jgi:hypothetical protein
LQGAELFSEFGILAFQFFLFFFDLGQIGSDSLNDLALSRDEQY